MYILTVITVLQKCFSLVHTTAQYITGRVITLTPFKKEVFGF